MASPERLCKAEMRQLRIDGRDVDWRLVHSRTAQKLRIKVGPDGIMVVLPNGRTSQEAVKFIENQRTWVREQLARVRKLDAVRRTSAREPAHILFRGEIVPVHVVRSLSRRAPNKVVAADNAITVTCSLGSNTTPARSLENWLRKQARKIIDQHIADLRKRLRRAPKRVYVMGQRTKWGNCSALGNLSFNWRLVMAPDYVLRYIVTHEMVHLAVPDHSQKFWLTVQSHCPQTERARQWLVVNGVRLHDMGTDLLD